MKRVAIILSGGTGTRLGLDIPKQYVRALGNPIIYYCLKTILSHAMISEVYVVADCMWHDFITKEQQKIINQLEKEDEEAYRICKDKKLSFSMPGKTRQLSIVNALEDMENFMDKDDEILIHDAARPLVTNKMISDLFNSMDNSDGAIPVLPMKDTVYLSKDGKSISSLLNRDEVVAGQAPEAFVFGKYLKACRKLLPDKILTVNGSTEVAIMSGMNISAIKGDENNYKITTKADLERFLTGRVH